MARSRILEALDALERLDRRGAAALIAEELREGPPTGKGWASVYRLADRIGETDLALDASRRAAMTPPTALTAIITHCGNLTRAGRSEEAVALLDSLPEPARNHPAALQVYGTAANERGDFDRAQDYFRRAIAVAPLASDSWFMASMAKTFVPGDPDFDMLETLRPAMEKARPAQRARFHYALGKALLDIGEVEDGFAEYAKGAALRRAEDGYDRAHHEKMVETQIRDYSAKSLASLKPSGFTGQRAIFVNGLPRSGTTMVESILCAHSAVLDGGEVNLAKKALIPAGDRSLSAARAYEEAHGGDDPWGAIAADYHHLLGQRFAGEGLIVDKTLSQSYLMAPLLHAMPEAKVIWMRRRPEDVALSAYRTYFTAPVRWSWSFEDIAHQMTLEDRLHDHLSALFPNRILTVGYEELVEDPDPWVARMLAHVGLEDEPGVRDFHLQARKVRTASVRQVRAPLHRDAVGKADAYADQLRGFTEHYFKS